MLVVGAGLAGLSAARELSHRGYEVTVLEARDRVGGRLWSSNLESGAIDLGAVRTKREQFQAQVLQLLLGNVHVEASRMDPLFPPTQCVDSSPSTVFCLCSSNP